MGLGMKKICIALFLLLATGMACSPGKPQNPQVAVVQGRPILLEDFHAQSAFMGLGGDPMALTPEMRFQVLDLLVERELVLEQADKLKIELAPHELDRFEASVRQGLEDEVFEKKLIEQGITYEEWREILRRQLLFQKTLDMLLTSRIATITPEQVSGYYEEHKDEFDRPEQVLAQHALFPNRQVAQKVAELMRKGQDLKQAALEAGYPLDEDPEPTWMSRGAIPKTLENVLFSLKPGNVAGPVASDYGFHVIRVLAKRPAEKLGLLQVAEEIQRRLIRQAKEDMSLILLRELREQAKIWMDNRFLNTGQAE